MSAKIDISGLTLDEQCFSVCRSLTKIFALSNRPRSIEELHKGYLAVCGHVKKVNERDPTSSIRSYIGRWNKLARLAGVGLHEKGLNGCKDSQGHRICRKAMEGCGTRAQLYMMNPALRKGLYPDPIYTVATVKNVNFIRSPVAGKKRRKNKQQLINLAQHVEEKEEVVTYSPPYYPVQEPSPPLSSTSGSSEFDDLPIPAPFFDYHVRPFTPPQTPPTFTFTDVHTVTMKSIEETLRLRRWNAPPDIKIEDNDSDVDLDFPSDSECDLDFPDEGSNGSPLTPLTPDSVPSPGIFWSL